MFENNNDRAPYNIINGGPRYVPPPPEEVVVPEDLYRHVDIPLVDRRKNPATVPDR